MTSTAKHRLRILTRLLGWVIGVAASLAAVTLLGIAIFVLFFDYPDYLRGWMEREATRILETPVTIEGISVDLPNYAFVIEGVRVAPRGEGPAPLSIDSVRGELSLTGVFDRLLHLRSLHVEGFSLRVDDYGGGRIEVPGHWARHDEAGEGQSDSAGPRYGFLADSIRFDDASFVYDNHNIPWRLEAEGLAASLERTAAERFEGRVRYEHGVVRVKEREPIEASVETRFELVGSEIRVEELAAEGDFYRLASQGRVTLGAQPEAEFTLHIESDVGPAARDLLGLPLVESEPASRRNPRATFEGSLLMGRGWHLVRGEAAVPRARFAGMPLRGFRARILWDRNVVQLNSTEGFVGGGATTVNFRQALPWTSEPAELELSFEDVLLSQILESVSPGSERFGSRISGNVNITFPLTDPSFASGRFSLVGVAQQEPDLSGLAFTVNGVLDQGELRLEPSRLESEGVVAMASGLYPRTGSAALSFEAEARDLSRADRLQQSLRTLLHPDRPAQAFGVSGSGRARGMLRERFPRLVFEGHGTGENVSFRGIRWGEVAASGSFSRDVVHFTSFRSSDAAAALRGRGTIALVPRAAPATTAPPPPSGILARDFDLDVEAERWPTANLEALLGLSIDLEGLLTGSGNFSSREGVLGGTGNLSVTAGTFQGHPFDVASSRVTVRERQLFLDELVVSRESARLAGSFHLNLDTLDVVSELSATSLPLADLGVVPFDVEGELQGTLRLGGRLAAPSADVEANLAGIRVAGWDLGEGRVDAELRENAVQGDFTLNGHGIDLQAELGVKLTRPVAFEGRAHWTGADVAPLLRSALPPNGPELPGSLRLISAGESSFAGTLGSVESLSASANLSSLTVEVADLSLTTPQPTHLELQRGELHLDGLDLVGENTQLRIAGEADVVDGRVDIDAEGAVNLAAFDALFPSMAWSGNADLEARLRGDWAGPELSGHIDLSEGAVSFRSFPQAIGDIHGRVLFDNRTVRLDGIESRFGGAPVSLTGTLSLNRLSPESFDLNASGKGIRLRYPEGLVAEGDAELRLTGTRETQLLSGQVDVRQATWSREYDVAAGILGSRDILDFTEGPEEVAFPDLRLDIRVNVPENFRVRNSLAVIDGHAELQVRGTLGRPALLGRAEADHGEVFLLGQHYDVLSGRVEFIDPNSIRPFFDLTAETRVRSYRVELRLAGTPDRFFPELSSDPPLRTVEIMRLLAGATERELRLGSEEEEVAGVGVASLLTERLNQELSRRAERLFGLDRISIDPFLVGQFSNPTARVSIGKQVSSDLAINYSAAFGETAESIVVVIEYTPEGPITYTISRDETGALAVDMKFRKSF